MRAMRNKDPAPMTNETTNDHPDTAATVTSRRHKRHLFVGAVAAPLALAAAGLSLAQTNTLTVPLTPVAVSTLAPSDAVAAKGEVAEIFGNKFVLQDGTGRALVETGPAGDSGSLVKQGENLTVQGRFENGFLHAQQITRADGTVVAVGPAGGPPPGRFDRLRERVGLAPQPDTAALTNQVQRLGYTDIRFLGRGPRHFDVVAKAQDGRERLLHVGFDGAIREKPSL